MKRVVFLYEKINEGILQENLLILRELWENLEYEVMQIAVEEQVSPDQYMEKLVELREDFLVTFAMAGFSWCGLMGQVRLNMLSAMQIHILIGNLPYYDCYLHWDYAIHSFFLTDCEEIFLNWKERYPQLPFMDKIPTLYIAEYLTEAEKLVNRTNLQEMLQRIFAFIENPTVL